MMRVFKYCTALSLLLLAVFAFGQTYPTDIRQKPMLFYNVDTQSWSRGADWFSDAWDAHHSNRWTNQREAYDKHYAGLMFPFEWKQLYVDDSDEPTPAEARDHTWSGYIWNQGGVNNDPIAAASTHPRIVAGDAMIIAKIGFAATATPEAVPDFMKQPGWWYTGGGTSTGPGYQEFLRYDVAAVRTHVENVLYAIMQKYGADPNVMFVFGEYFTGNPEDHPSGFSPAGHKEGVKEILTNTLAIMPRIDGKRQMLGLSSPTFGGSFVRDDIISMGLVPVESNVEPKFPPESFPLTEDAYYFSQSGIHVMAKGDSRFYDLGKTFSWEAAPDNPWDYGSGDTAVLIKPEQYAWYKANVIPTHSVGFNTGPGISQTDINTAIGMFGRGGSEVATWGAFPVEFVGADEPDDPVDPPPGPTNISADPIYEQAAQLTSQTTHGIAIGQTPIAGSLGVVSLATAGPREVLSVADDWIIPQQEAGSGHAGAVFYKKLEGNEATINFTLNSANAAHYHYAEYAGTHIDIDNPLSDEDIDNIINSNRTSTTGGSVTLAEDAGLAIFTVAADSSDNITAGRSFTEGFTEEYFGGNGGNSGLVVADKVITSVGAIAPEFTTTDSGDQLYGVILVFPEKPVAAGVEGQVHINTATMHWWTYESDVWADQGNLNIPSNLQAFVEYQYAGVNLPSDTPVNREGSIHINNMTMHWLRYENGAWSDKGSLNEFANLQQFIAALHQGNQP